MFETILVPTDGSAHAAAARFREVRRIREESPERVEHEDDGERG